MSYGVYVVKIWEQMECIIMAPYCIYLPKTAAVFYFPVELCILCHILIADLPTVFKQYLLSFTVDQFLIHLWKEYICQYSI